ncbi:multidrug ABC transporter ATPase [Thermosipho melanesiensis]|uniref:ABC transporter related n=2 Tax=Thermosipho melanesiensis TaxID=46541 RepID=A6LMQ2_THEM4|nr:ABC transporter ATP-binding protein [Thermosipho melanesiensis]ABR31203.1 ABC transporter related [Thermosipho melanesiensis BI429]APT74288.1 multidrug ABC transporter ATPase [Thermosipho melanesiensis]OOC36227.1 multidrug ABC transporter ATPase [Thermosipho melanesiensis]OOC37045.1 multidrug ABC transporter ATPase [Thermosipho melanesiensis]OOC37797.1 multidrug ABC transporter ATPase [Thermosipho melanesiensis]
MLKIENLKKSFKDKIVLSNISFKIDRGEILALIGPNGVGKTTTLNCISHVVKKDNGKIFFNNEEFTENMKHQLAYVPEDRNIFQNLNGYDYKKIWSNLYPNWNENVFEKIAIKYNLDLNKKIEKYSQGLKTLFLVALAVSSNAEILLLDEPTQHLDPTIRVEIMKIMREYADNEKHVLVSSHEIFEIEEYADKIAIIKDGEVIYHDYIDHAKEKHRIIEAYQDTKTGTIIGLVGNNLLVKTDEDIGRYPKLNEIIIGYLNEKQEIKLF